MSVREKKKLPRRPKGLGIRNEDGSISEKIKKKMESSSKKGDSIRCRATRGKDGEQCENKVKEGFLCHCHIDGDADY